MTYLSNFIILYKENEKQYKIHTI